MKFLLCILLLFIPSFGYHEQSAVTIKTEKVKGIICTNRKQWESMFEDKKFWRPTKGQVLKAEAEIERFLKDKPPAQSPNLWQKLPRYKRQYVGVIIDGHKRIYCDFSCSEDPLSCQPVIHSDGGDCFFQVEYDVEGQKVEWLRINGDA